MLWEWLSLTKSPYASLRPWGERVGRGLGGVSVGDTVGLWEETDDVGAVGVLDEFDELADGGLAVHVDAAALAERLSPHAA